MAEEILWILDKLWVVILIQNSVMHINGKQSKAHRSCGADMADHVETPTRKLHCHWFCNITWGRQSPHHNCIYQDKWVPWLPNPCQVDCLFNGLFGLPTKHRPILLALCVGNTPMTKGFLSHTRASKVDSVSMSWLHHVKKILYQNIIHLEQNELITNTNSIRKSTTHYVLMKWLVYNFRVSNFKCDIDAWPWEVVEKLNFVNYHKWKSLTYSFIQY